MNDAARPPLAYSTATFIVNPAPESTVSTGPATSTATNSHATTPVQFMVDFAGSGIEGIPPGKPPHLYLSLNPPETVLRESNIQKIGYGNSWRASFTIIPWKHHVPTELHCRLMQNASATAKPLSEEWTYTWHQ
jgi:glucan biosynthesis protein